MFLQILVTKTTWITKTTKLKVPVHFHSFTHFEVHKQRLRYYLLKQNACLPIVVNSFLRHLRCFIASFSWELRQSFQTEPKINQSFHASATQANSKTLYKSDCSTCKPMFTLIKKSPTYGIYLFHTAVLLINTLALRSHVYKVYSLTGCYPNIEPQYDNFLFFSMLKKRLIYMFRVLFRNMMIILVIFTRRFLVTA